MSPIPPHPGERDCRWLSDWRYRSYLGLDAVASSPREARGLIRKRLPWWGLGHLLERAELVATELITNSIAASIAVSSTLSSEDAVDGGTPPVRLWILGNDSAVDSAVGVLVWDAVMLAPAFHQPSPDSGRMPVPASLAMPDPLAMPRPLAVSGPPSVPGPMAVPDPLAKSDPLAAPDPLSENGRGLRIVAALSRQVDCYFPPVPFGGKIIRALIS
jgi:hypothetical protein